LAEIDDDIAAANPAGTRLRLYVCWVTKAGIWRRRSAEEDRSAWRAEPPVRSGGRVQGGIAFEQRSAATALLSWSYVAGRCQLGVESDEM
jgi:hypothetical protein